MEEYKTIKAVIKKAGETHGHIVEIKNRLKDFQNIVGGYIETWPLTEDI